MLFSTTALMLTFIQVPHKLHFLAWVAWVPFVLACREDSKTWRLAGISLLVGTVYWLGNLWWLTLVTVPGYIGFCIYLGLYWPILAVCVRFFRRKGFGLFIALPLLITGAEAWQGIILTGFIWRLLAHSQYANTTLIQISDIFGATGVTFIIAMVNGLVCDLLIDYRANRVLRLANAFKTAIVALVIASTLVYGHFRLDQYEQSVTEGPLIGSVQPNIPSYVKEMADNGEIILNELIEKSDKCLDAGAELVVWPETIVLATMNKPFIRALKRVDPDHPTIKYDEMISDHANGRGYIFFGAHAVTLEGVQNIITERFNSGFLYRPDGSQDPERYDKIHLVPFGEFIPLKNSVPFMYRLFRFFSPYDYDYSLTRGSEYTVFKMNKAKGDGLYRFGALICYEDTDPEVTRKMAVSEEGEKKTDWLVNISNDGWYVRFNMDSREVLASGELSQRTAISAFRAVENRISIVRSVNTGISCVIESSGRIKDGYVEGNLPETAMERQAVDGWMVDRIKIDKRITLFSKYGKWPDIIFAAAFVLTLAGLFAVKFHFKMQNRI